MLTVRITEPPQSVCFIGAMPRLILSAGYVMLSSNFKTPVSDSNCAPEGENTGKQYLVMRRGQQSLRSYKPGAGLKLDRLVLAL